MKIIREHDACEAVFYSSLTVEPQQSIKAKEEKTKFLRDEEEIALKVAPDYSGSGQKTTIEAKICGGRFKQTDQER